VVVLRLTLALVVASSVEACEYDVATGSRCAPGERDCDSVRIDAGGVDAGHDSGHFAGMDAGESDASSPLPGSGTCDVRAPAGSFDPAVKWTWNGSGVGVTVTPLVANLGDDDGDGDVDLDDTPDVLVVDANGSGFGYPMVVLDGATGLETARFGTVAPNATPAIGDLDRDGRPEIVALLVTGAGTSLAFELAAFHGDGSLVWSVPFTSNTTVLSVLPAALAIADLDGDGAPEILAADQVLDSVGTLKWAAAATNTTMSPVAADLDGDGSLEVVYGLQAYHHDSTPYFQNTDASPVFGAMTAPAIADLDGDGKPEIVLGTLGGLVVLDHMGNTLRVASIATAQTLVLHDVDGDGLPEVIVHDGASFLVLGADLVPRWQRSPTPDAGVRGNSAFDFLGDGTAEPIYTDDLTVWCFHGTGDIAFMAERAGAETLIHTVVADVDNDGSADLLIASQGTPGLRVLSDRQRRWIPARRIMNQDSYHVTNVEENGAIPQHEQPHWKLSNSFRAQAQINAQGQVCLPSAR
jgi:hypothetical protein